MTLREWAARWGLPEEAIREFVDVGLYSPANLTSASSESRVQSQVRLECARAGMHVWRNNVGAGQLANGSFLRWGLANDSHQLNEILKSGDLIGIRKKLIRQEDVGQIIGQFVSRECKPSNWKFTGTPRDEAQLKWATLIQANGGDAKIVTSVGSV